MNEYNLINSKAIREHCKKIKYKFNTEELAVLIYRNKMMSVEEKISAYKELINNYPDMEVIERINCKYYVSVKDMIRREIERLKSLNKTLLMEEEAVVYSYNYYCYNNYGYIEGKNEYINIYKSFKEVEKIINKEILEDEEKEIVSFVITKRTVSRKKGYTIRAEYLLNENRKLKMINIYDFNGDLLDISNIFLNIPTPFKRGDLLVSYSNTPFSEGYILNYKEFPFVLNNLFTWNERFEKLLNEGNLDSSDMQGPGYLVSEDGVLYYDNVFNYDGWEYYKGELEGTQRLLKTVSSLIKNEIGIDLFIRVYENIKLDYYKNRNNLTIFSKKGLKLIGLDKDFI